MGRLSLTRSHQVSWYSPGRRAVSNCCFLSRCKQHNMSLCKCALMNALALQRCQKMEMPVNSSACKERVHSPREGSGAFLTSGLFTEAKSLLTQLLTQRRIFEVISDAALQTKCHCNRYI